jgi:hypothetical protein
MAGLVPAILTRAELAKGAEARRIAVVPGMLLIRRSDAVEHECHNQRKYR